MSHLEVSQCASLRLSGRSYPGRLAGYVYALSSQDLWMLAAII